MILERFDVAVVGSGPAGLEAAVNLKIRGKTFALFGSLSLSRKVETAPRIENYLGIPGVTGRELQRRFWDHLQQMEIRVVPEQIQMVYPIGEFFSLASTRSSYEASAVILAPGAYSAAPLEGEVQFLGRGVSYCATCDGPLYRGKTVAVLGYSEEASLEAEYLAGIAAKTYYMPLAEKANRPVEDTELLQGTPTGVAGGDSVRSLLVEGRSITVDGVFILRDTVAPASLLSGIALRDGFIQVDADMATNIPGCFAAGDCTGKPHQYMRAAGQGQIAALNAAAYLDRRKHNR